MSSDIEHLRQRYDAAQAELEKLKREVDQKAAAAAYEVKKSHDGDLSSARTALSEARAALDAAMIEEAGKHLLVGKRVRRKETRYRFGWPEGSTTIDGVVEVFTWKSERPANQGWALPKVGELAVRLLKKDGTPGIKVEKLSNEWQPVEEPQQ